MSISSSIFNLFGRSPIRPIQRHMAKAAKAVNTLVDFFSSVEQEDWHTAEQLQTMITKLEHEADALKQDLRLHLPTGMFMPVHRSDILELLSVQDSLANRAKDIAGLVLGRQMTIPKSLHVSFMNYLQTSVSATKQAQQAISELDELLETGFSGNEVKRVEQMIIEIDKIEHDNDSRQIELRNQLFHLENDLEPINVMFLYKIIDWIGDIADRAQGVGGKLQLMLAR